MALLNFILQSAAWRAKSLIGHIEEANAPTLYDYDRNGLISPTPDRPVSSEEQQSIDAYNNNVRAQMVAQAQMIQRVVPGLQPIVTDTKFQGLALAEIARYTNYPTETANETARLSGLEAAAKAKEQAASNRSQAAQRATDRAAAEAAAASAAAAAAFRASEIEYTNSQGGGGNSRTGGDDFGGYNGFAGNTTEGSGWGRGESGGMLAPIVLDLGGDGIDLYANDHSLARFDADDDGYAETTAWAGPTDGILVIDEGGDNQITQSKEIAFAKWTAADDTDLQGLAATFDSNQDGVLDARDERFADFKVWRDANSNGVVDADEMQTLEQAGIQSMNLSVQDGTSANLDDGSIIHGLFDVQRADGKTIQGADVALAYNTLGYRTVTDAQGNTVIEFERGGALHYRNMAEGEGNADFNLGTDTDAAIWIGASGNAGANVLDASGKTTEVLLDGGAETELLFAIELGAISAMNTRAGGRFGTWSRRAAVNDGNWRAVA